jgi:hypothetical protein
MILENALIYKILIRLKLNKIFLLFWRKKIFRNLLNFRRIILFKLNKTYKLNENLVISRVAADLTKYGIAKAEITEFDNMPSIIALQKEYEDLLAKDNLDPHDRKAKSYIQRLVDDDYTFDNAQLAITRYCLNEEVAIACAKYLGMIPKLTSFKIWRSH